MTTHLLISMIISIFVIALVIVYAINVAFSRIMFDIFGVDKKLAFIPYYNSYRIFAEYKGRVWKKNWGVMYLILSVVPLVFLLLVFSLIGSLAFSDVVDENQILGALVPLVGLLIVFAVFELIFGTIVQIVLYWPILRTKTQEWIFIAYMVLSVLPVAATSTDTLANVISFLTFVISIVFLVIYFSAASSIRRELKHNQIALFERLDYATMSKDEIILELKRRKRKLTFETNAEEPNANQETTVDKIEYI